MEEVTVNLAGKVQRRTWAGRDWYVAPLSMLVPGVLNGSRGPLLYPPEEVARNPEDWNGMPIVLYHPTRNGQHVSARDPEILEKQGLGYVFQAKANGRLTASGWFDIEATRRIDPRVLEALEAGKPLELSTGLFTENIPAENGASHNGKSYAYVARNYKPDHLAVLPDQVGACSLEDGCGVLVNSAGGWLEINHGKHDQSSHGNWAKVRAKASRRSGSPAESSLSVKKVERESTWYQSGTGYEAAGKTFDTKKEAEAHVKKLRSTSKDAAAAAADERKKANELMSDWKKAQDPAFRRQADDIRDHADRLERLSRAAKEPGSTERLSKLRDALDVMIKGSPGRGSPRQEEFDRLLAELQVNAYAEGVLVNTRCPCPHPSYAEEEWHYHANPLEVWNSFCPTGEGGGIDPSCSPGKGSAAGGSSDVFKRPGDKHLDKLLPPQTAKLLDDAKVTLDESAGGTSGRAVGVTRHGEEGPRVNWGEGNTEVAFHELGHAMLFPRKVGGEWQDSPLIDKATEVSEAAALEYKEKAGGLLKMDTSTFNVTDELWPDLVSSYLSPKNHLMMREAMPETYAKMRSILGPSPLDKPVSGKLSQVLRWVAANGHPYKSRHLRELGVTEKQYEVIGDSLFPDGGLRSIKDYQRAISRAESALLAANASARAKNSWCPHPSYAANQWHQYVEPLKAALVVNQAGGWQEVESKGSWVEVI